MATVTKAANAHTVVTTGWTNPSNAFGTAADSTFATGTPGKNGTVSGDFGFADFTTGDIPNGSVINSVTLNFRAGMTAAVTGGIIGGQLMRSGVAQGSETTNTGTAQATNTQQILSGISLTDLRSASTIVKGRIRVAQGNTSSAMTGNLDFVSITVDFTAPIIPPVTIQQVNDAAQEKSKKVHRYPGAVLIQGLAPVGPITGTSGITLPLITWASSASLDINGSLSGTLPLLSWSMAGSAVSTAQHSLPSIQQIKRPTRTMMSGAVQISGLVSTVDSTQGQQAITLPLLGWSMAGTSAALQAPAQPIVQVKRHFHLRTGAINQLGLQVIPASASGALSVTLPLLTWRMTGLAALADIAFSLPMIGWHMTGEPDGDSIQFWVTVWKRQRELRKGKVQLITRAQGVTGNTGTMGFAIPKITVSSIGTLDVTGQMAMTLPLLTWNMATAQATLGQMIFTLPLFVMGMQGALAITGQVIVTLPMLGWNMAENQSVLGTVTLNLPKMTMVMQGEVRDLDGTLLGSGPTEGQLFPR